MSRYQRIYDALSAQLKPAVLSVENESSQHHVPEGSETHFKIIVVSSTFQKQTRVARHKNIHTLLADELKQGLHALSLYLYTPEEWAQRKTTPASPSCRGGMRRLK
jgi:BolA protein